MDKEILEKVYDPKKVESRIYSEWEASGYFHADENSTKPRFCIVIPPPNVTGMLTMGHVLNNTLQDILIRYHRMLGEETLWLPGTDHAGIATQNVVEKYLAKEEKLTRHDLGREKFLERVWQWKEKYGGIIISQLKRLGCSCDWQRERFTMDEGLSNAVTECFIRLYNDGLIYKGKYIINWCPRCRTALSDEEKIPKETKGNLWYIKYPIKNANNFVVVATTRPETMLGDTAVAVNPNDTRYKSLIGKTVILPLIGREIPIIADESVDIEFGTGAVKVTPAHDPNDFEIGKRHNLPSIVVMDEDAVMNENAGKFRGLNRFKCREEVIKELQSLNLLEKVVEHEHAVGHCERCDTIIEPYLSDQWFVRMKPLAQKAIEAVKNGALRFTPERWVNVYLHWLENIRDWCISRQLWWGHRIPAYTCKICNNLMVAKNTPLSCSKCNASKENIVQDEDVLDTWFSSWLWPFSTMGWPEETQTMRKFYPTDVLVTGPDIIFFWVARMVMAGYYFMNQCPFHDVYFTSIVRDLKGRKMSKSLGNSPDPLDIIDQYGADALRFTIISLAPIGQDIRFAKEKVELGRNFANKIWNAARFVLMNIQDANITINSPLPSDNKLGLWEKWILSRAQETIDRVRYFLTDGVFRFNDAIKRIYDFIWDEYCDWYIEVAKYYLYHGTEEQKNNVKIVLLHILDTAMRLLHPFMPFITEEIWQKLPKIKQADNISNKKFLMTSEFPKVNHSYINVPVEKDVSELMEIVRAIRNLRACANIPPSKKVNVRFVPNKASISGKSLDLSTQLISNNLQIICWLAGVEMFEFVEQKLPGHLVGVVSGNEICLDLHGLVDINAEKVRISNEITKIQKEKSKLVAKIEDQNFMTKAPEDVILHIKSGIDEYNLQLEKLNAYLNELEKMNY